MALWHDSGYWGIHRCLPSREPQGSFAFLIRDGGSRPCPSQLNIWCMEPGKPLSNYKGRNWPWHYYSYEPTPESVLWIPVWSFLCMMAVFLALCSSVFSMLLVSWPWNRGQVPSPFSLISNSTASTQILGTVWDFFKWEGICRAHGSYWVFCEWWLSTWLERQGSIPTFPFKSILPAFRLQKQKEPCP